MKKSLFIGFFTALLLATLLTFSVFAADVVYLKDGGNGNGCGCGCG